MRQRIALAFVVLYVLLIAAVAGTKADPPAGPIEPEPPKCRWGGDGEPQDCPSTCKWTCTEMCECPLLSQIIIDDGEPVGIQGVRFDLRWVVQPYRPTGVEFANATVKRFGLAWPSEPSADSCENTDSCHAATDLMCEDAGHGGAVYELTSVVTHPDGSKTCSSDCALHGAVAFIICHYPTEPDPQPQPDPPTVPPPDTPDTVVDEPDPTSVHPVPLCDSTGACDE